MTNEPTNDLAEAEDEDEADIWTLLDKPTLHPADDLLALLPLRSTRVYVIFHFAGWQHIIHVSKTQAKEMLREDAGSEVLAVVDDGDVYLFDERSEWVAPKAAAS